MNMLLQKLIMDQQALDKQIQSGFAALISVILIGAVGLAIAVSVLLLGLSSSRNSLVSRQSSQAKLFADSCAEEALQKLKESVYYTGSETLNFTLGSCQIQTITGTGNSNRTIQTTGTVGAVVRKVKIVVGTVQPTISITSWQELADF